MTRYWFYDLLIILGIIFNLGALFLTNAVFSSVAGVEGYAEVAKNVESNPFVNAQKLIGFENFVKLALFYSFVVALYIYNKDKYPQEPIFKIMAAVWVVMHSMDFFWDFGVVYGLGLI